MSEGPLQMIEAAATKCWEDTGARDFSATVHPDTYRDLLTQVKTLTGLNGPMLPGNTIRLRPGPVWLRVDAVVRPGTVEIETGDDFRRRMDDLFATLDI